MLSSMCSMNFMHTSPSFDPPSSIFSAGSLPHILPCYQTPRPERLPWHPSRTQDGSEMRKEFAKKIRRKLAPSNKRGKAWRASRSKRISDQMSGENTPRTPGTPKICRSCRASRQSSSNEDEVPEQYTSVGSSTSSPIIQLNMYGLGTDLNEFRPA